MDLRNSKNELKFILKNLNSPKRLENHPWTKSSVVQSAIANDPELQLKKPSQQLVQTLVRLFRQSMPSTLPKRGERPDTNWAQFGILAARYFAPIVYGTVPSNSLRDAGGRIDEAVRYFVFNTPEDEIFINALERFEIIGNKVEPIPMSTLSDWHTKGLSKLAETFSFLEQRLNNELPTPILIDSGPLIVEKSDHGEIKNFINKTKKPIFPFTKWRRRNMGWVIAPFLIVAFLLLGNKVLLIFQAKNVVFEDLRQLISLVQPSENNIEFVDRLDQFGKLISLTKTDLANLISEAKPLLWFCRFLFWVPKYGGDLAQANELLSFADKLIEAADEAVQGVSPILETLGEKESGIIFPRITTQLVEAQPALNSARVALDAALDEYSVIDFKKLSPNTRNWLSILDLKTLDIGLNVGIALPRLLSAPGEGLSTYLVLLQNEDELRATGGLITGVATLVVENGKILSTLVEDSPDIDNLKQYSPPAPWQLERYMAASNWFFRDSNWSPDFPTAAKWAEMFIAKTRNYSVDGVIAVDQESLIYILKVIGPISIANVSYQITADNIKNYMRLAKSVTTGVHRKEFMGDLLQAVLQKIETGDISWQKLGASIILALDERHIQIQMDDPAISSLLAQKGWDGAVSPHTGDFLLVVDSNIGFNKVNAVMKEELGYEVDFNNIEVPTALLTITHKNNATGQPSCNVLSLFDGSIYQDTSISDYAVQINLCYLDYLRIYRPDGVELIASTPHVVPAKMIPWNESIPAKVDNLTDENDLGVRGFGTLIYVPGGGSLETNFKFLLPSLILGTNDNLATYSLHVQKQSGTIALPLTIIIHFPKGAQLIDSSLKGSMIENIWTIKTDLRQDVDLTITFKLN
ncbi:MAG: DUF4012 domain-containing protein [Chloroflexi bacterium]|nr:DUF4012 domain-containing protein [Chloroflexota bacterium]